MLLCCAVLCHAAVDRLCRSVQHYPCALSNQRDAHVPHQWCQSNGFILAIRLLLWVSTRSVVISGCLHHVCGFTTSAAAVPGLRICPVVRLEICNQPTACCCLTPPPPRLHARVPLLAASNPKQNQYGDSTCICCCGPRVEQ